MQLPPPFFPPARAPDLPPSGPVHQVLGLLLALALLVELALFALPESSSLKIIRALLKDAWPFSQVNVGSGDKSDSRAGLMAGTQHDSPYQIRRIWQRAERTARLAIAFGAVVAVVVVVSRPGKIFWITPAVFLLGILAALWISH